MTKFDLFNKRLNIIAVATPVSTGKPQGAWATTGGCPYNRCYVGVTGGQPSSESVLTAPAVAIMLLEPFFKQIKVTIEIG